MVEKAALVAVEQDICEMEKGARGFRNERLSVSAVKDLLAAIETATRVAKGGRGSVWMK